MLPAIGGIGPNTGHTFTINGQTFNARMLLSAAFNINTRLAIGTGVIVNPPVLTDVI